MIDELHAYPLLFDESRSVCATVMMNKRLIAVLTSGQRSVGPLEANLRQSAVELEYLESNIRVGIMTNFWCN